ncbi:MAG TPA: biotin transporter BioY [Beijerinckiaceae bacterium]
MFAALIAALGLLPRFDLPIAAGVPITAQTLGVMLAGALLGPRQGPLAVVLFLFVVACGAPLLAGGRGGLGVFASPTAGYLVGWIAGAAVTGWVVGAAPFRSPFATALAAALLGGVLTIYAFGVPWLAWHTGLDPLRALIVGAVFLPGDILKAIAAAFVVEAYARGRPVAAADRR